MVRKRGKTQADLINLRFNACAKRWSQFKKDGVKAKNFRFAPPPPRTLITRAPALMPATLAALPSTRVAPAHACSGSRTRALFPSVMSRSACWIERSNSGVNSSSSSIMSSSHARIWRSSACESLRSSVSICSTLLTRNDWMDSSRLQAQPVTQPGVSETSEFLVEGMSHSKTTPSNQRADVRCQGSAMMSKPASHRLPQIASDLKR